MLLSNLNLLATAPSGVARLRELILTLAVQGKLVPQDPADEPASELLKKIRAEKDRLMAEGKIKRDKPLAEITDDEKPFELPKGWEWVKGRDLFSVIRGVTYQKTDATDVPIATHLPILRANNIRGKVNLEDLVYVPASLVSEDQVLRSGDYVVCLASGSKNLVGKAAPFTESLSCSFGAFCGAIRPVQELAYFAVYLASPMYRDYVSQASAGIGINNLKGSSLLELDIALPPNAEQSRIVTRVEELMRLCDALEAKGQLEAAQHAQLVSTLLATLTTSETPEQAAQSWQRVATHFDLLLDRPEAIDALEQTILQLAVRGLLVPQNPQDEPASALLKRIRAEKDQLIQQGKIKRDKPLPPIADDEKPFALPDGWEWVRAIDICALVTDGDHLPPPRADAGVPFLVIGDVRYGSVELEHVSRKVPKDYFERLDWGKKPLVGDVLYTTVGSFGIPIPVVRQQDFCFQRHIALFRPAILDLQAFIAYAFKSTFIYQQAEQGATGIAQKTVPLSALRAMLIPLPPLAEQSRIIARVTELRQLCARLRERLAQAQGTQRVLAQALVTQAA